MEIGLPPVESEGVAKEKLRGVVEQSGSIHQLARLQAKGIQEVRVISHGELASAMQRVLLQTLQEDLSGIDIPPRAAQALLERVKTRLSAGTFPSSAPVQSPLRESPENLATPTGSQGEPIEPDLSGNGWKVLETRMTAQLGTLLSEDFDKKMAKVQRSHRDQVELLEQRIAKLARALESTDQILSRLGSTAEERVNDGDPLPYGAMPAGAALTAHSPLFAKKSELLNALFNANVALQHLKEAKPAR